MGAKTLCTRYWNNIVGRWKEEVTKDMENRMSNKLPNQTKAHHTPRVRRQAGPGGKKILVALN